MGLATYIIFQLAKTYFSDFQLKLLKTIVKSSLGNIKWRPLLSAMYKTNYDGAMFSESGKAGIGVVV